MLFYNYKTHSLAFTFRGSWDASTCVIYFKPLFMYIVTEAFSEQFYCFKAQVALLNGEDHVFISTLFYSCYSYFRFVCFLMQIYQTLTKSVFDNRTWWLLSFPFRCPVLWKFQWPFLLVSVVQIITVFTSVSSPF